MFKELRDTALAKDVQVARTDQGAVVEGTGDVSAAAVPQPRNDLPKKKPSGAWVSSSWDLLRGCEVTEISDSVPDDLLDELFQPHADSQKSPTK